MTLSWSDNKTAIMNGRRSQQKSSHLPAPPGWRVAEDDEDSEVDPSENVNNDQSDDEDTESNDPNEEENNDISDDEDVESNVPNEGIRGSVSVSTSRIRNTHNMRTHRPDPDETDSARNPRSWTLILIIFTLVVGPACSLYLYPKETSLMLFEMKEYAADAMPSLGSFLPSSSPVKTEQSSPWERFKHKFKTEFTPKYVHAIPKSSMKVIKSAVKDVMVAYEDQDKFDSLSPSVILILGKEGNKNVSCFSRDLERIIASSYNEGVPDRLKGDTIDAHGIDAAFKDVFENKKQHLIVIDGLNKLDGKSAAHLHRFTDHE